MPATFYDIDQIKAANKAKGHHFFDRDTMRFFRGRVTDNVYPIQNDGALFVHSIHNPDLGPRQYRVAWCRADGSVDSVDDDRAFPVTATRTLAGFRTLDQAKGYAKELAAALTENPPTAWGKCAAEGHPGAAHGAVVCSHCCACLSCSISRS